MFIVSPLSTDPIHFSISTPFTRFAFTAILSNMHKKPATEWRKVWVYHAGFRGTHGPSGEISGLGSCSSLWANFLLKYWYSHQELCTFNALWNSHLPLPYLLPPSSYGGSTSVLGTFGEKWAFPAISHITGVAKNSLIAHLFPQGKGCLSLDSSAECSDALGVERGSPGKVPLTISIMTNVFFLQCWISSNAEMSHWEAWVYANSLWSMGIFPGQNYPGFFLNCSKRGSGKFPGSTGSAASAEVSLLITRCTGGQDFIQSPGVWCWILQLPPRCFCSQMNL